MSPADYPARFSDSEETWTAFPTASYINITIASQEDEPVSAVYTVRLLTLFFISMLC